MKTWLTLYALVTILLIGAATAFCFITFKKNSESKLSWDDHIRTIKTLSKKEPTPKPKAVADMKEMVQNYEKSINELYQGLNKFQKPLDTSMNSVGFKDAFSQKVEEFRAFAREKNFEIIDQEEFKIGFDVYENTVPPLEIVGVLNYELGAIDYLLRLLISSGVESLDYFKRDLIPGEANGPKEQAIRTVHKYPVRVGIRTTHKAFQNLMNSLSKDSEYFYVVRILKVSNETEEGPLKVAEGFSQPQSFVHSESREPATLEQLQDWGEGIEELEVIENNAKLAGYEKSGEDSRVLLGEEKLKVFMVIDITRFIDPSTIKQTETRKSSSSRRRK